jgi:hypothetical protein
VFKISWNQNFNTLRTVPALGLPRRLSGGCRGLVSRGGGREVEHSPLSVEVKSDWSRTFTPLISASVRMDRFIFAWNPDSELLKNFPAFYGTQRFITVLTSARHLFLSCARSILSMPPTPPASPSVFSKIYFNIIISSTLGSFKWPYFRFSRWNPVCTSAFHYTCYMPCPSQPSWLDHPNDIWWVQSIQLLAFHEMIDSKTTVEH